MFIPLVSVGSVEEEGETLFEIEHDVLVGPNHFLYHVPGVHGLETHCICPLQLLREKA